MPIKLDKYGIKIFWACDAKNDYPYLRKEATGVRLGDGNVGLAAVIVQTLTKDFQWTGTVGAMFHVKITSQICPWLRL